MLFIFKSTSYGSNRSPTYNLILLLKAHCQRVTKRYKYKYNSERFDKLYNNKMDEDR